MVAGAALTAALALVALPGLAGSRSPNPTMAIDAAAFQAVTLNTAASGSTTEVDPLDPAHRSAGFLDTSAHLVEPGIESDTPSRPEVAQPRSKAASVLRAPRYTLTGEATFYDHGTTAMRLPRGTRVVICGGGGCIERVVSDYGPQKPSRIVDLYRPDFFAICGCPWYAGVTKVTVHVY
jgi:hypothetical protein